MNLETRYTDKPVLLAEFHPVGGLYSVDAVSGEHTVEDIESAISEKLSNEAGFPVGVQLFHSNGHEIGGEAPTVGSFLATRK